MIDVLLRMLLGVTLGLVLVLLLRRPVRRVFGAGPAFTLWLLPIVLALAPLLPRELAPTAMVVLPGLTVTPHVAANATSPIPAIDGAHGWTALWLLGTAIGLLRLALHYFRLLRGMRAAPDTWMHMLADAAPDLDPDRVRLHAAGPAVLWALPRSLILLPEDFPERFDHAATRELVLRHELTHAGRGDAWWSLAMEIASALLWFHPLAWIARPRFRLDQELACDAASLRTLPEHTANYARALLDSVAVHPAPALIPWLAEPQLKERIAMITRIQPNALRRRAGVVAVATLLTGGLLIAGGQTPVQAETSSGKHASAVPPSVDITYKNRNPPHYPAEAIKQGEQGNVVLDITVDAAGKVTGVQVDQRGTDAPAVLQVAALQAAANWKFNPGRRNGKAVGGVIQVPVRFSLDENYGHEHAPKPCPIGNVYEPRSSQCVKLQPGSSA
ncbi:MAG: Ferric siderophore transport system, periplasmic binding protein TonB [Rhodanobacteraceae bacterium]|jgi:TonB family protein|nr:MAG: Ferric siderophore transport system, periplasmic binding protein TonB [Rhodanobacteraceae bacterium]